MEIQLRCEQCHRLLALVFQKENIQGTVEIKCSRCKGLNKWRDGTLCYFASNIVTEFLNRDKNDNTIN